MLLALMLARADAAPLTCEDLREMTAAHLPDASVADVVASAGVLATDLGCVETLPLGPDVLAAARAHLVTPPQKPTEGPAEELVRPAVDTVRAVEADAISKARIDALSHRLDERTARTRRTGTTFTVVGISTAVVGGLVAGIALGSQPDDLTGLQARSAAAVVGSTALTLGVIWTSAGVALTTSAGPRE